jgi:hypothetical protein
MKQKQSYEINRTKAYVFLWEQCAKAIQRKIESSSRFELSIKDDPIELLKIIKQHALNYHEHQYKMAIMFESLRTLVNLKQKEGESLQDYTKRFKTSRDVVRLHIGRPVILSKYMTTMKDYDEKNATKVAEYKEQVYQQLLAYIYLDNSDKAKYGTLINGLQTQQSLKTINIQKQLLRQLMYSIIIGLTTTIPNDITIGHRKNHQKTHNQTQRRKKSHWNAICKH